MEGVNSCQLNFSARVIYSPVKTVSRKFPPEIFTNRELTGYYVGYLITRAYYRNAKDKRQAVHDILNIKDTRAFYAASGVRSK